MIKLKQLIESKDSKDAAGIAYFFNDMFFYINDNPFFYFFYINRYIFLFLRIKF